MTIDTAQQKIRNFKNQEHARCIICGADRKPEGFGLEFKVRGDQSVEAEFVCDEYYTGYAGRLHGGVVASLLDGAMTTCLAAWGIIAVTAELNVRFKKPVHTHQTVIVRAYLDQATSLIYYMKSELLHDGEVRVSAKGKFVEQKQFQVHKEREV
ncbi:PaaI family thioesterase [bacterium]|nr:PaaI family thioesterase [bacterium]